MARSFVAASNQYLTYNGAILSDEPLSMACWFYGESDNDNCLMVIADTATSVNYFVLFARSSAVGGGYEVQAQSRATGVAGTAVATASWSENTWHHACGVWSVSNSRTVYLDGGNKHNETTDVSPAGLDRTSLAVLYRDSLGLYLDGRIAEAAIWNAALTDEEVAILAAGYPPSVVRPQSLVSYWQEIRDTDDDIVGGYSMTAAGGPTIAAHPPVIYAVSYQVGARVAIPTDVVWGHDTAVSEDYVRNFHGTWTGTGDIENQGVADTERLALNTTEYMISEIVNTGAVDVEIEYNVYSAGDAINLDYRHGATVAACEGAAWNDYAGSFTSLGFIQVRVTSTL